MKPHRLCSRIWGLKLHTRHFSSSSTWGHWLSTLCSILLSTDLQLLWSSNSPSHPPCPALCPNCLVLSLWQAGVWNILHPSLQPCNFSSFQFVLQLLLLLGLWSIHSLLCESPSLHPSQQGADVYRICSFSCEPDLQLLLSHHFEEFEIPRWEGWIPDSIWVSLQLYYMCKLYDWIVSVEWIQYCHTDLGRLSVSWSCSLHHDCLGPSEAQMLEKGTFWIDCILPIFCSGLSIHDSVPQHRRNMSLQQKSMIKKLWSVYISF